MPTQTPAKSDYIKIPRALATRMLQQAREIQTMDKAPNYAHSANAYANALGRCNGIAGDIVINLEVLMEVR